MFDALGNAVDYQFLEANPAFERHTGLGAVQGKSIRQIAQGIEEFWFETFGRVALTGEPIRIENHARALEDRWFDVFAFRVDHPEDHHVAILFTDISARKASEHAREAALRAEHEANALLDALGSCAPVGLAFLDRELRFRRINPTMAAMNGLPVEAHLGKRPDELFHHVEDVSAMVSRWESVLAGGETIDLEVRGATAACPCETRTWLQHVFQVRVQGETVGLGVFVEDVTERVRAQQALAASEARFRSLIELGPIGIAIADPDGHVVLANDALLALFGYTREEMPSLNWREHTPPEHLALDLATIDRQRHDKPPVPFEKDYVRRDGTRFSALVVAQFLPGEGDRMIAYALDITDRKNTERALRESESRLRRAADALRDADRRKDDFIATLAHELRNPLAPIRSGVQILKLSAPEDPKLQRTAEMMERQIKHLVRLVDDLLDISRITRGKIVLQREAVDLNQILTRALEASNSLFERNAQRVRVTVAPQPLLVRGDADRLTQVFSNLLSNAAKFTPHEGAISLAASREGEDAVIRVRDTGIGIPPERLETVFEMFNQIHSPHGNDGLGIGLALVRQILKLHGGTVVAASEGAGRGSCFTVRLPALVQRAHDTQAAPHGSSSEHAVGVDSHHRILVVDDNRDAVESLEHLLKLRGHDVAVCTSGVDAVALTPRYRPDVILMDLGMPEMDGLTAAHLIRAQPSGAAIRIIALTGWGQDGDRERTREAGIDEHLVKPVSWEALIDAVEHNHIQSSH